MFEYLNRFALFSISALFPVLYIQFNLYDLQLERQYSIIIFFTFFLGVSKEWLIFAVSARKLNNCKTATQKPITTSKRITLKHNVGQGSSLPEPTVSHYRSTREALKGSSAFIGHTYDKNIYFPPYEDKTWKAIQYYPWDDTLDYSSICNNVLKRITQNGTFYIISGSFNGGLGHKYISIFHSITYAILLGRRFLRFIFFCLLNSTNAG